MSPFVVGCRVLLVVAAVASVGVFTDYGITWDEGVQAAYGEMVLDYFASAGTDARATEYSNLFYYGPLFESAAAAAYRALGGLKYEIRHAAIGLTALLTLVAVWRYGRMLGSSALPFFAMLALLMMPRFVGHAFNNSKDVPFACGFAWAMVGIGRLLAGRNWRWPDVVFCGATIGLAMAVRVGAVLLLLFLTVGVVASWALSQDERRSWSARPVDRALKLITVAALAWTITVACWPWAHGGPLTRPLEALAEMSSFTFSYTVYFAGELIRSNELPRHYLPFYLAIVTPVTLLALAGWGLVASARDQLARASEPRSLLIGLTQLWLLFPVAWVVATRPNVYDGIRHFLFVLPALALLCGLGANSLREKFRRRRFVTGMLALLMLLPLVALVRLHPYQSSFFNVLVGGIGQAWRSYDTDYWASSYREAMEWVLDRGPAREPLAVAVACNSHSRPCAEYYLESAGEDAPRVTMYCVWNGDERVPRDVRYYVGMLRYGKAGTLFPDWPVVHSVGRGGAVFSVIKRNPAAPG